MGLFRPEMADQARSCLEMMDFEGKDMLLARLEEQGRLQRQVEELKGRLQQLGQVVDRMKGTTHCPGGGSAGANGLPRPAGAAGAAGHAEQAGGGDGGGAGNPQVKGAEPWMSR